MGITHAESVQSATIHRGRADTVSEGPGLLHIPRVHAGERLLRLTVFKVEGMTESVSISSNDAVFLRRDNQELVIGLYGNPVFGLNQGFTSAARRPH